MKPLFCPGPAAFTLPFRGKLQAVDDCDFVTLLPMKKRETDMQKQVASLLLAKKCCQNSKLSADQSYQACPFSKK
jgi:hypothetical protein